MAEKKTVNKGKKAEQTANTVETSSTRGRIFEGFVTKKFLTRVVIEFERTVFVKKYERFYKKKTKLHARIPPKFEVNVGDYVKIQECRPLSKIIHFIVIEIVRKAGETKQ